MQIIDAHAHISDKDWLPQWYWDGVATAVRRSRGVSREQAEKVVSAWCDPTGDNLIECMDQAGVSKMMVCVLDFGLLDYLGDARVSIEEQNRLYGEIARKHPDRFVYAVGVDPRRRNAVQILERGVKEYGAKALKLYPPCGFYPNDRMVYPLYEKCVELGIPVDFHTGPTIAPFRNKYSHPIHLDDVATDFPELTIMATHCGHESWHEMLSIAKNKGNIVCDLAAWQSSAQVRPMRFYETFRHILDVLGPNRLMFASDSPGSRDIARYTQWVKMFTEIPDSVKEAGIEFTEQEMVNFLGGNATRLLQLQTGKVPGDTKGR